MGNAAGGVHAAAIGGLWQAVAFGFAGLRVRQDGLVVNPRLLPQWRRLSFPLYFRGRQLRISITPRDLRIAVEAGSEPVSLALDEGSAISAAPDRQYLAERQGTKWSDWREVRE